MFHRFLLLCAVAPALTSTSAAQPIDKDHAAKMAHGLDLFKQHVRPMLTTHCLSCHGGKTTEAELDISDRDRLLKGGNGGAAIVPGDAAKSLLYRMMAHEKKPGMPFEAAKLPDALLKHTAAWIDNGAPYDAPLIKAEDATAWTRRTVTRKQRRTGHISRCIAADRRHIPRRRIQSTAICCRHSKRREFSRTRPRHRDT